MKKSLGIYFLTLVLIPAFVIGLFCKIYNEETNNKLSNTKTTTIKNTTKIEENEDLSDEITIKINKNGDIQTLSLEEYIVGVVAGEMPASFDEEALKAQAVASRTYALYQIETNKDNYDVETTTDDQVFITVEEMKEKWESDFDEYYKKVKNAVESTKSQVMKINGKVFKSYYCAMSNGYTEDSVTVFGEKTISSVESPWDNENLNSFKVDTKFSLNELTKALNVSEIKNIDILSRDSTNRVSYLKVNDKTYTGIEFRHLLKLRSADFTIKKQDDDYIITTRGYGHGVGMSQYGANGMAEDNYKYKEILKYYYQNIEITTI